ncbi:MAG: FtsW/RodA/SpoVE family cell cycle protein, partial [Clostridia bacterium]
GLFNSRQKYLFLPFAESDFIFAIIGEETGLFGCLFVIVLFLFVIFCGIKIAMRATTRFDCYLSCGIVAVIAIQTLLNIAVVSGSIPPTGLPLPFVSAGGSSLVVFLSSVGILDNIYAKNCHCQLTQLKK